MRTTLLFTALVLALAACTTKANRTHPAEVSKPLDNSYSEIRKGRYSDLVDQLYADLVKQSADLKQLDARLNNVDEQRSDSTAAYTEFNRQNDNYYTAAERHTGTIRDSVLRAQVLAIVKQSSQRYRQATARHQSLLSSIAEKVRTIEDSHEALKVLLTLPVIQQYQKDARPSTKSMEDLLRELEGLKKEVDALKKKHGVQ